VTKARKRSRSRRDQQLHAKRVQIVVVNLAYAILNPSKTGRLAVDTRSRKSTRYDHEALKSRSLRALLSVLVKHDIVHWQPYAKVMRGEKGSIAPTDWFSRRVEELNVSMEDFGYESVGELILLTRKVRPAYRWWDEEQEDPFDEERIDYDETRTTTRMRRQVASINAWLNQADITFVDDGGTLVAPRDRSLTRRFVVYGDDKPKFNTSGRLFGGFWLNLKKSRRAGIRIDGEAVVDLDYKSMFPRLAYAHVKAVPPMEDLYDVEELRGYRSGVKLAMSVFMFNKGIKRQWPKSMGLGVGNDEDAACVVLPAADYDGLLPSKEWTVKKVKDVLIRRHPPLADCFNIGLGHRLMFMESELLVSVLLKLKDLGIVALPMHDGVLVPTSRCDEAVKIMKESAEVKFGMSFPVTVS
jgi:hypothetical protein